MDGADPRQLLARRLRALREERWPGMKITQPQLARALGGDRPLSVPLISSWESQSNPKIPPFPRLEAYAALFATTRSFTGDVPRLISPDDMDDEERRAMTELRQELAQLRNSALGAGHPSGAPRPASPVAAARVSQVAESLRSGPWRFEDGNTITVVSAQLPPDMLTRMPYTDLDDPDYIQLNTFSELDALFELHGHLRAANPANQVDLRIADLLTPDEYTSHLVSLGGVDWNQATRSVIQQLALPVRQVADWTRPDGQYFEVEENGRKVQHKAALEEVRGKKILRYDVALFARAANPFNRKRTVTICNGMYGRGTYGAVRALTDARFRDRNAEYLKARFGRSASYCILMRVPIVNRATITPDWTLDDYKLFEWSGSADASGPADAGE